MAEPQSTCTIDDCELKHKARGLCRMHYQRLMRRGTTESPTPQDRFWAKVQKGDGCWEWTGSRDSCGYGMSQLEGGTTRAHRVSYTWERGEIPEGHQVDHLCHNRACVNPEHLRLATRKQNMENRRAAQKNSTSGIRGVSRNHNNWSATVSMHGKGIYLGTYKTAEEAGEVAAAARKRYYTHSQN